MRVRTMKLQQFMAHDRTEVALPEQGIVVVVGHNGSGKSSLVEAAAAAFWGKTLRGTPWWREGETGSVEVGCAGVRAFRERKKGASKLEWTADGVGEKKFPTQTKAQEELERIVGSWEVWRRVAVFSSHDASHFSLATDRARKELIEQILGLERFEPALRSCRDELKQVRMRLGRLGQDQSVFAARVEGEAKRLADALAAAELAEPPKTDNAAMAANAGRRREIAAEVRRLHEEASALGRQEGEQSAEARLAAQQLQKLGSGPTCPTCGQGVPDELRERLRKTIAEARATAKGKLEDAQARADEIREQADKLETEQAELVAAHQSNQAASGERARWERAVAGAEERRREIEESLKKLRAQALDVQDELEAARAEEAELAASETVLGLRGVRAQVLAGALGGLEAVANAWLARIYPGVTVRVRPDRELKGGGTEETISLEVLGMPHGYGYAAESGGERRRLDVALMLALAEVAAAAAGASAPGTLFFDEVFDALDADGIEAVSGVLAEMAQERCVVVITHLDALAERLPAALRLRAEAGTIAPC